MEEYHIVEDAPQSTVQDRLEEARQKLRAVRLANPDKIFRLYGVRRDQTGTLIRREIIVE